MEKEISAISGRDISGLVKIHGRNDFSSQWKLAEEHGSLSGHKTCDRVARSGARKHSTGRRRRSSRKSE